MSQTAAAATTAMSATNGKKLQVEAWRRDIAATTATGADKTTANFFHAGAVFLLGLGTVLHAQFVRDTLEQAVQQEAPRSK